MIGLSCPASWWVRIGGAESVGVGCRTRYSGQVLGLLTIWVTPHHLARECTPLPVPEHERNSRSARETLTRSGALGADQRGRSSFDGGAHRRRLSRAM